MFNKFWRLFLGLPSKPDKLQAFSFYPDQDQRHLLLASLWLRLSWRCLLLALCLVALPLWYQWQNYSHWQAQRASLTTNVVDNSEHQQWRQQLQQLQNLQTASAINESYLASLYMLAQAISAEVKLVSFSQQADGQLEMTGVASAQSAVLALVAQLEPQVQMATLASLRQAEDGFQFVLTIQL